MLTFSPEGKVDSSFKPVVETGISYQALRVSNVGGCSFKTCYIDKVTKGNYKSKGVCIEQEGKKIHGETYLKM